MHRRLAIVILLLLFLLPVPTAGAQSSPPTPLAAEIQEAQAWVGEPERQEPIAAYAPAARIERRVYAKPRPLNVWITRIDLAAPGVRLIMTEPTDLPDEDGAPRETRCANTLEFAQATGAQLAVNASAFSPFRPRAGLPMDVVGLGVYRGVVYSQARPGFGALYVSREGQVALNGPPLPTDGVWHVLPGFRMLVDDGAVVVDPEVAASSFGGVNPRTALGVDCAGRTLWIVVVDGRQQGSSEGITLVELAVLFQSLGVWDALNLDGGGSSTFVLQNAAGQHEVVNVPVGRKEPGTLRQVANNLGVFLPGSGPVPGNGQSAAGGDDSTSNVQSHSSK